MVSNNDHGTSASGIEIPVVLTGNPTDEDNCHQNVAVIRAQTGDKATAGDPITIHITLGENTGFSPPGSSDTHHTVQLPPGAAAFGANMNAVTNALSGALEEILPKAEEDQDPVRNVQSNSVEYAYASSCARINTSPPPPPPTTTTTTTPSNQPDIVPVYEDMSLITGNNTIHHQYLMQSSSPCSVETDIDHEYVNSRRCPPVPEPPSIIQFRSSRDESSDEVSGDGASGYVNTQKFF